MSIKLIDIYFTLGCVESLIIRDNTKHAAIYGKQLFSIPCGCFNVYVKTFHVKNEKRESFSKINCRILEGAQVRRIQFIFKLNIDNPDLSPIFHQIQEINF